jgi:hypothetical protein
MPKPASMQVDVRLLHLARNARIGRQAFDVATLASA